MSNPKEYLSHGEENMNEPTQPDRCVVDAPGAKLLSEPGYTSSKYSNPEVNAKLEAPKRVKESGKME